jgi:alkylation response protein AidB-like acyl-CoA dehydrogenase
VDFDDTPDEAAFRAEARAFLAAHASLRTADDASRLLRHDPDPAAAAEHVARCKAWQRTLFDGGWAGITWPAAFGGRGGTGTQQAIFDQEQAAFDVSVGVFAVGIGMVGPTLIAHGTDGQKARYLEPLLRGEEIWCQLFSEPGAGSDLAGLSTRAVLDGDEWVVDGQKVWTSGAQHSDWGILLARTDPTVPKHRGITFFVVDMRTPGIEVRPLRQINGVAHFNEVFLTGVRIPSTNVIGEVGDGWRVARTTLANERGLIGGGVGGGGAGGVGEVIELARRLGRNRDPLVRQGLAALYVRTQLLRYLGLRARTASSQGRPPGPESSVLKLAYSRHAGLTGDLVLEVLGASGCLAGQSAVDGGFWQQQFLGQWSVRIGGGTDQIQRNVIGERVLGLPPEPRADRDVPFRELSAGRSG